MKYSLGILLILALTACGEQESSKIAVPGVDGAVKTVASVRALRRAYDGAPPVIPHDDFKMNCVNCHKPEGLSIPEVGFAPPMPHELTTGISAYSRCRQCHVFKNSDATFVENSFVGLHQDLRHGDRLHPLAPPVLPHRVFMRENCLACHTGPAAREEIRCSHPERTRCLQCHMPQTTNKEFSR